MGAVPRFHASARCGWFRRGGLALRRQRYREPRGQFAWLQGLQAWALPLWFAGVFVFSLRLAWGCRQVSVLRRTGEPAAGAVLAMAAGLRKRLGLHRAVAIVITQQTDGPSVVGWLRPVILLPAATLLGLSEQQLAAVLTHELAHIRRHDYLVNLLQNLVETLLFYHPAVWWTSERMRQERELCCDDAAVDSCGDALCYARALTVLEKLRAYRSLAGHGQHRRLAAVSNPPADGSSVARNGAVAAAGDRRIAAGRCLPRAQYELGARAGARRAGNGCRRSESPDSPGVQVDIGGATVVERTGVEYPGYAWERKIGGIVVVEATLDAHGNVSDARILSGPAELRKNALQSVLEWHFASAPAGSIRQVSINFQWEQAQKDGEQLQNRVVRMNGTEYGFSVSRTDQTLKFLEEELAKARQNPTEPGQVADLEKKLAVAQDARALEVREPGIIVSRIDITGLTDVQQKQLAERLPVRLGDRLTQEQSFALAKAVGTFDPPLALGISNDANHQLVIRISPDKSRQ